MFCFVEPKKNDSITRGKTWGSFGLLCEAL